MLKEVDTNTPLGRWLYNTVDRQAQQVGIRTPQVFIYESDDPNAFATGAFHLALWLQSLRVS